MSAYKLPYFSYTNRYHTFEKKPIKELKQELNLIFQQHKEKYKSLYNGSGTFQAQAENGNNFSPVIKSLSDKLIFKANEHLEKNGTEHKTNIENHIKELITDFNTLMINPNK